MGWGKLLAFVGIILFAWVLFRTVRGNPDTFSKVNLNKSAMTMGVLGLILIAFIAFCILLLRMA